jgi:hypothetical protein
MELAILSMMNRLTEDCLKELVNIGKAESFQDLIEFQKKFPEHRAGQLMRETPQFWYSISESLKREEIIALIKTFTIAEKIIDGWKAGSVSPVVWLFKKLKERTKSDQKELFDWIIDNTENVYLPTGSMR